MEWQGYEVGKRVVCVVDTVALAKSIGVSDRICQQLPKKGSIYTIARTKLHPFTLQFYLSLAEFPIGSVKDKPGGALNGSEWWFWAGHFRPLDESRLDQFRQYLHHVPADMVPA